MERTDRITVTGSGRAAATVDQVDITLGVEVLRPDAGDAFATAAGSVSSVLSVLADNGVDSRAARTADLNVGPRTEYVDGRETLLGYQAAQRLHVRLENLSSVQRLLSEVIGRGGPGVRIDQVTLSSGHPQQELRDARDAAFADARAKAEQYAELAGRRLGEVVSVLEPSDRGMPIPMAYARTAMAATAMPVAGGDTDVAAQVTVTWALHAPEDLGRAGDDPAGRFPS